MIPFLTQFSLICRRFPERPAVVDRDGARVTDYRSLNALSGKAAAYLKSFGIGREDVVAILLPKGLEHIAVRLAVMKVGAAWVSLSESMGPERARFAMDECRCRLAFDTRCWEDAMLHPPLDEAAWAEPDMHDLAFIIYTSGSTGSPKGAMQEYGIYERISAGTHVMFDAYAPVRFAHLIPEHFVGGVYITVGLLQDGGTIHVISSALTRDLKALLRYFKEHEITGTFAPPALARLLLQQEGLPLRIVFAGGEIVSRVFSERCDTMNIYGPSEFGHPTCIYLIKRLMDNTPVGSPVWGTEALLVSEDGKEAENEGVLCVALPWFRGYVSSKDKARRVFLHGRSFYYSGDFARREADGNYTILARADNIINLNGNRIDPSEIEAALKKVLGREHTAVKVFDQGGKPFLCCFYDGQAEDPAGLAGRLEAYLPSYMIPARFVHLDSFPINSAGKVDHGSLRLPESRFAPYAPPVTAAENALCKAMEAVLETGSQPVGLDDDFFSLGGESVTAMRLILEAGLPGLDMALLYRCRTVREIAGALRERGAADKAPAFDPSRSYPLLPTQSLYALGGRLLSKSIAAEFRFSPGTDAERLAQAVSRAVMAHSALWTVMLAEGEGCVQRQDPRVPEQLFAEDEDAFSRPFRADGKPLIRAQLIPKEGGCILRLNVHHIICDGSSFVLLIKDILNAYRGEDLENDDYPVYFAAQQAAMAPALREQEWDLLQKRIGDTAWVTLPSPDAAEKTSESRAEVLDRRLEPGFEAVHALAGHLSVSVSSLFTAAALLALGFFEGAEDLLITWTWNGRSDLAAMRRVGLLLRDLLILQRPSDSQRISDFIAETEKQRNQGIAVGGAAFLGDRSDETARRVSEKLPTAALCFIYHDYLPGLSEDALLSDYSALPVPSSEAEEPLQLHIWDIGAAFRAEIQYDVTLYSKGHMRAFLDLYAQILRLLCGDHASPVTVGELRKALLASGSFAG